MGFWNSLFGKKPAGPPPPAPPPKSPRELFADEAAAVLRKIPSVSEVRFDAEQFALHVIKAGAHMNTVFLNNAFAETREMDPGQRARVLQRMAANVAAPPPGEMPWEEAKANLVPLLRSPSHFFAMDAARRPLSRPFAPHLVECVGLDRPDGIAYVMPAMLESWKVTAEQVFELAAGNARGAFTGDVASYDEQAPYPLWYVARDDDYESSRLLVPGWLASFAGKVNGRPVAIAPAARC